MKRADFIHLIRLSEHASADDSTAYRRNVAAFAALGYAWVVGCAVLAAVLLWWLASSVRQGQARVVWLWWLAIAVGLLWSSLRALWLRLEAPKGQPIQASDAPLLFEALERIRAKVKGPAIHHVLLTDEFNASICQIPRYGLFGGAVNYLCLGLPLVLALERPRLYAVLAHEYGHLRGDHGLLSAWIYRTRITWLRLQQSLLPGGGVVAAATQGFLRWYFPRFAAKTFALARQDEYEADQVAARLVSAKVMASALVEMQVKGHWLQQEFWASHWRQALDAPLPLGPFASLAERLPQTPDAALAQQALWSALRRISDVDDTHPVLRDRLESLNQPARLPTWSRKSALALLGPKAGQWLTQFDQQWCRDHASRWKQHHAYLDRRHQRARFLLASLERNNAQEMTELAELQRKLDPQADVQAHFERALAITPDHSGALRGLVRHLPPDAYAQRMACLGQLFAASMALRWWTCKMAVQALEERLRDYPEAAEPLKLWRERLKQADEAEQRAKQEHTSTPVFHSIRRHDLSDFEMGELCADLARIQSVTQAWLVCKSLREFPHRRCYTLFLELPDLDNDSRYELCRQLEQQLELPGSVLVLWAGESPSLQEIEERAFHPVYPHRSRQDSTMLLV